MIINNRIFTFILFFFISIGLSSCGSITDTWLPDKKIAYKKEKQASRYLEVPPDLTNQSFSDELLVPDINQETSAAKQQHQRHNGLKKGQVLPQIQNIELMKEGDKRWLVIHSDADTVWQAVIDFWQNNGVLLTEQNPIIGVMRTNWLENRAKIDSGLVSNTIRRVFDGAYSSAIRDQYRVRIEENPNNKTVELFLTHFGMEEDIIQSQSGDSEQPVWKSTGADPELEAIMLRRIMVHLGVTEKQAEAEMAKRQADKKALSHLIIKGDVSTLVIDEDISRSWRLIGIALERAGFAVEDRDRSQYTYMIRYFDPTAADNQGFLSGLAFWRKSGKFDAKKLYHIQLNNRSDKVDAVVLDENKDRLNNATAKRILTLIQEQLK